MWKKMVRWPKACVGCGLVQPDLLKRHDYVFRHSVFVARGYSQDTYHVTILGVDTWLCNPCATEARIRYVAGIIITLISLIVSMSLFVFALNTEILFDEEGSKQFRKI